MTRRRRGDSGSSDASPLAHSVQRAGEAREEIRLQEHFLDPDVISLRGGFDQLRPHEVLASACQGGGEAHQCARAFIQVTKCRTCQPLARHHSNVPGSEVTPYETGRTSPTLSPRVLRICRRRNSSSRGGSCAGSASSNCSSRTSAGNWARWAPSSTFTAIPTP